MLRAAGVDATLASIPTPAEIFQAADERMANSFLQDLETNPEERDERSTELAARLLAKHSPEELVACLLRREAARRQGTPRQIRDDAKPAQRERKGHKAGARSPSKRRPRGDFITYQVSWGAQAGADTRRLLAMVCRRGDVSSDVVGTIRVQPRSSTVDIAASEATRFEQAVARPDKRNPRAQFRRWDPKAKPKRAHRKGPKPYDLGTAAH